MPLDISGGSLKCLRFLQLFIDLFCASSGLSVRDTKKSNIVTLSGAGGGNGLWESRKAERR